MAEGFLRAYASDIYDVFSAGTKPTALNPLAVQVMREVGIDISSQRSKSVSEYLGQHFSLVITVCDNAKEHCPIFPGPSIREHWPFEDPAESGGTEEELLQTFRDVRDEVGARIRSFVSRKNPPKHSMIR